MGVSKKSALVDLENFLVQISGLIFAWICCGGGPQKMIIAELESFLIRSNGLNLKGI